MTHRILIIGVGSIGERHLRCFLQTGRVLPSICEVNPALRSSIERKYGIAQSFDSLEAALEQSYEGAVVAVPAHLHIPIAQTCANRDLHLLIEKPLSISMEGIDDLRRTVSEKRLVAGTAYVYRASSALASMQQAIASGRFGAPVELVSVAGQNFPHYRPAYADTYYGNRATGGGAIQDALTHLVNAGEWLVGPTLRVVADAEHKLLQGVSVEDVVHVLARHGAVLATYSLNQFQAPNETTITVVCERGTARFEFHYQRWRWCNEPGSQWHDEAMPQTDRDSLFTNQATAFLNAIESRESPLCSIDEGLQTLRTNLAIMRSLESELWEAVMQD